MADHGILFTDQNVRLLASGAKTVTRRTSDVWAKRKAGDLLWVRECWARHVDGWVCYRADGDDDRSELEDNRWRPSIHMPRWASRYTLEVVSITREAGMLHYGIDSSSTGVTVTTEHGTVQLPAVTDEEARLEGMPDRAAYLALWRSINGDAPVDHVWRIEFRLMEVPRG